MIWSILGFVLATAPTCGPKDLACQEWRCALRQASDCRTLAARYAAGDGVPKDVARAAALEERARSSQPGREPCPSCEATCRRGPKACEELCRVEPEACVVLGRQQLQDDPAAAQKTLRQACERGSAAGCGFAGAALMATRSPPASYLPLLEKGCAGRDPTACGTLGLLLVSGQGVKRDERRGAALLGQSCEQGYAPACGYLGQAYENGAGLVADEERAGLLYQRGCDGAGSDLAHAHACYTLADLLDVGKYLPKDVPRALGLYRRACARGEARACARLDALGGRREVGPGNPALPEELAAITALGRQIAEADAAAAHATDALLASKRKPPEAGIFFATREQETWCVQFGRVGGDGKAFVPARVFCARRTNLSAMEEVGPEKAPKVHAQARAVMLASAEAAAAGAGPGLNPVVLADPGGITVYLLQGTTEPGRAVMGGDFRIRTDREGRQLVEARRLHRSAFTLPEDAECGADASQPASRCGTLHSHVLGELPTETDVATVITHPKMAPHHVLGPTWAFRIGADGAIEPIGRSAAFTAGLPGLPAP